jgi:hypothetical protein
MTSLTPASRADEATAEAAWEGTLNGVCTLIPSIGLVALAYYRHPTFALRTTAASRTAMAIMPALFISALSSELKMVDKMREMANENQHNQETVRWAEDQWQQHGQYHSHLNQSQHLAALYEESIAQSYGSGGNGGSNNNNGVRIVPQLLWYHQLANFTSANPLKVLTAVAVPAIGYIFYGRSNQPHLQMSSMIMHTRVFGQGLTLLSLLGIMGFKSYMDHNVGRFLSQEMADARVNEMRQIRERINVQLSAQQQHQADLQHELQVLVKQQEQQQQQEQQLQQQSPPNNSSSASLPSSSSSLPNVTHNNSTMAATTTPTTTTPTTTTEHLV